MEFVWSCSSTQLAHNALTEYHAPTLEFFSLNAYPELTTLSQVSFSDWYGFYNNISPLIEDDNYFQLMVRVCVATVGAPCRSRAFLACG